MNTKALDRDIPPKPPSWGMMIAITLELAIVLLFVYQMPSGASILGLILCCAYAYFSATWAAMSSKDPD